MFVVSISIQRAVYCLLKDNDIDKLSIAIIMRRLKKEGVQFATKTLPLLSKAVLRSLEIGYFERPTNFKWKGRSLELFSSLLDGIFQPDGKVKTTACADSIRTIRQVCDYIYKLAFDFTESELEQAAKKFVNTESSVKIFLQEDSFVDLMRKNFETHYGMASKLTYDELVSQPRNGPGSFAKHSARTSKPYYVERNMLPNTCPTEFSAQIGVFKPYPAAPTKVAVVKESRISEVLFVPKDSRGPRVISREPQAHLRVQMSFFDTICPVLERVTHRRINFADQSINQKLALQGSIKGDNCTLDLKDGSDNVSYSLVRMLFRNSPGLYKVVNDSRSTHSVLNGEVIHLRKLSGMGSGLTFPIMALVIHLAVCTEIALTSGTPYEKVMRDVYVYGDDLICPRAYYTEACRSLTKIGLQINTTKSFVNSKFRESCGADFYNGSDVTPVRLKLSSANLGRPSMFVELNDPGILQLERHCRELVKAGLWQTANYFYARLEEALGPLPNVTGTCNALGRYVFNENLIDATDSRVFAYVAKTRQITVERDPYTFLGGRLVAKPLSVCPHLDVGPEVSFESCDVPRGTVIRKRKVINTSFLGR